MYKWSVRMHGQNALDASCRRLGKKRLFPTLMVIFSLNVHFGFVAMIFSFIIYYNFVRLRFVVYCRRRHRHSVNTHIGFRSFVSFIRCLALSVDRHLCVRTTHTHAAAAHTHLFTLFITSSVCVCATPHVPTNQWCS